jgi:hypothetical protein
MKLEIRGWMMFSPDYDYDPIFDSDRWDIEVRPWEP